MRSTWAAESEFYRLWLATLYGDLKGRVRLKAQIHDSVLFAYRGLDAAKQVHKLMEYPIPVKDVHGVTRTLLIPPELDYKEEGAKYWADIKS